MEHSCTHTISPVAWIRYEGYSSLRSSVGKSKFFHKSLGRLGIFRSFQRLAVSFHLVLELAIAGAFCLVSLHLVLGGRRIRACLFQAAIQVIHHAEAECQFSEAGFLMIAFLEFRQPF